MRQNSLPGGSNVSEISNCNAPKNPQRNGTGRMPNGASATTASDDTLNEILNPKNPTNLWDTCGAARVGKTR